MKKNIHSLKDLVEWFRVHGEHFGLKPSHHTIMLTLADLEVIHDEIVKLNQRMNDLEMDRRSDRY